MAFWFKLRTLSLPWHLQLNPIFLVLYRNLTLFITLLAYTFHKPLPLLFIHCHLLALISSTWFTAAIKIINFMVNVNSQLCCERTNWSCASWKNVAWLMLYTDKVCPLPRPHAHPHTLVSVPTWQLANETEATTDRTHIAIYWHYNHLATLHSSGHLLYLIALVGICFTLTPKPEEQPPCSLLARLTVHFMFSSWARHNINCPDCVQQRNKNCTFYTL